MKVNQELFTTEDDGPKKRSKIGLVFLLIMALSLGFYGGFRYGYYERTGTVTPEHLDYSSLDELYSTIKGQYDGEIDSGKLIEGAKKGLVDGLGDPYSTYFTDTEAEEFLDSLEGSFEGIGAELGRNNDQLTILSVVDGSPADKNGLLAGDVIARVDDADSINWSTEEGVAKIRGAAGSKVKLVLIRGSGVLEKEITRERINDPSVRWEIKDGDIGYMRISRFGDGDTSTLAAQAADEFKSKNVKGIILDLRGNGGGYVNAAEDVAGLWLDYGEKIVEQKNSLRTIGTMTSSGPATLVGIPTIVLINGYSASASEIVAGALRDNGAAQLLGTKTYGKGVVQALMPLLDGGRLKLTIAKWYTPNGHNISGDGLAPDIEVEFDGAAYQQNRVDNQLNESIAFLKK
ncbi:MAG: S41 family peptidase [Candidatus Nomurabacteria bacterium]|jgi:carboxyl-terminal processing protease|nr:S41 family peptidase [Candidatus Nomurabacteria bacterium]